MAFSRQRKSGHAVPKDVNLSACLSELFRGAAHQMKRYTL